MVRDLLREDGLEWDIELVKGLFFPQDAKAILSIPVSESVAKDRMVWTEDKKDHFSIMSAYWLAQDLVAEGGDTSCSDPTKMQGVWSLNLPNKIKHFVWNVIG